MFFKLLMEDAIWSGDGILVMLIRYKTASLPFFSLFVSLIGFFSFFENAVNKVVSSNDDKISKIFHILIIAI